MLWDNWKHRIGALHHVKDVTKRIEDETSKRSIRNHQLTPCLHCDNPYESTKLNVESVFNVQLTLGSCGYNKKKPINISFK